MHPRPILLGMNNPGSADPERALDPSVPCTAGNRLFELIRTEYRSYSIQDHDRAFERRNLVDATTWSPTSGRRAAARLRGELAASGGRTVVTLGREVRDLLRVPQAWPWILGLDMGGWTVRCLPHPSGRCRWYNGPNERQHAAILLLELAAVGLARQDVCPETDGSKCTRLQDTSSSQ